LNPPRLGSEWFATVRRDLEVMQRRARKMGPAWKAVARAIEESVMQRFDTETDHEGERWEELSEEYRDSRIAKPRKKAAKKARKKAPRKARKKVAKKTTAKRRRKKA
jgi:hypothetical protein